MKLLEKVSLPIVLCLAYLTRILITGASIGDALVMAGCLGLYGFSRFSELKARNHNEETFKLINQFSSEVQNVKERTVPKEKIAELEEEIIRLKNNMANRSAAEKINKPLDKTSLRF